MKVSQEWLGDYLDLAGVSPKEIEEVLTLGGTEVERISPFGGPFPGVVVAEVVSRSRVANSDHLWLAMVRVPGAEPVEVVCGAPNLFEGALIPWAAPGAVLPNGQTISARRIRGVQSQGMLCAADELALGSEHDGVLILDPGDVVAGQPLAELFPEDTIYDLEILSNRGDCLSHWGVARELAALLDRPVRDPGAVTLGGGSSTPVDGVSVSLKQGSGCSLYLAQRFAIGDGAVGPSPLWLRRRLMAVGSRSISPIVDVANYVMLDVGQPVHTFDLGKLRQVAGSVAISVRPAGPGEQLACLDGVTRAVPEQSLLVTASDRPVALAGIIGGTETAVDGDTREILLEVASFDWASIRRAESRLGLRTDASSRFERVLSPELALFAAARFGALLAEVIPGSVFQGEAWSGGLGEPQEPILVSVAQVSRLLGIALGPAQVARLLSRLHFGVEIDGDALQVRAPGVRSDVRMAVDVAEEVGRIVGYQSVPATLPAARLLAAEEAPKADPSRLAAALMVGVGFTEAVSSSMVASQDIPEDLGLGAGRELVPIQNPLSLQLGSLRASCLPGLLRACELNQARGQERIRLFESGRGFWYPSTGTGLEEPDLLAMVDHDLEVGGQPGPLRLRRLLQICEALGSELSSDEVELRPAAVPGFAAGAGVEIWATGVRRGVAGVVDPRLLLSYQLRGSLSAVELRVDGWFLPGGRPGSGAELSKTPALKMDLAVKVPEAAELGQGLAAIKAAGISQLERVEVLDEYRGPQLPPGSKGWTLRLLFRDQERTLTNAQGVALRDLVLQALSESSQAELR